MKQKLFHDIFNHRKPFLGTFGWFTKDYSLRKKQNVIMRNEFVFLEYKFKIISAPFE